MRSRVWARARVLLMVTSASIVVVGMLSAPTGGGDRVQSLTKRLRCPVCQAESVADSPSETAAEMTKVVQEEVEAGRSDDEILRHFRARYGDWILLDPPRSGRTLPLWILPPAAFAVGIVLALTRRSPSASTSALTDEQRALVSAERRRAGLASSDSPVSR